MTDFFLKLDGGFGVFKSVFSFMTAICFNKMHNQRKNLKTSSSKFCLIFHFSGNETRMPQLSEMCLFGKMPTFSSAYYFEIHSQTTREKSTSFPLLLFFFFRLSFNGQSMINVYFSLSLKFVFVFHMFLVGYFQSIADLA